MLSLGGPTLKKIVMWCWPNQTIKPWSRVFRDYSTVGEEVALKTIKSSRTQFDRTPKLKSEGNVFLAEIYSMILLVKSVEMRLNNLVAY